MATLSPGEKALYDRAIASGQTSITSTSIPAAARAKINAALASGAGGTGGTGGTGGSGNTGGGSGGDTGYTAAEQARLNEVNALYNTYFDRDVAKEGIDYWVKGAGASTPLTPELLGAAAKGADIGAYQTYQTTQAAEAARIAAEQQAAEAARLAAEQQARLMSGTGTDVDIADAASRVGANVSMLYSTYLARNPTPEEQQYWVNQILSGNLPESALETTFIDASGIEQTQNKNIVASRTQQTEMAAGTGQLPVGQQVGVEKISEQTGEIVSSPDTLGQVSTTAGQVGDPTMVGQPSAFGASTYMAAQTGDLGTAGFTAGELSANALVANIQGQVSEQSLVQAAQGTVSPQATVKFQMEELMQSVEEGEPFPAWAAPAARSIGAIMQKRGLGASSMASAALMQAVVESGIPIAAQDAQTYAQIDLQNLNNRQQAALQNAATYAAMDRANLDARMQAAITNAQSFLAIDLQNLTNEQRSRELEYQSNVQRMFTNQAATNSALQFNAQSQNQVDMFFSELATQVETANANRSAAAEQFNVSQSNAMEQFTASLNNARDQFNTSMSFQVNQSNAEWRRQINTVNTAADNNANLQNAQNAFGASQNAISQLWQEYRDELAWINTSAENAQARAHEITLYALQQANVLEQLDEQVENSVWERLGERIVDRVIPPENK